MPDRELEAIYAEANRRGLFKNDPELQRIGHEMRKRKLVSDPTQGGLVTPAPKVATARRQEEAGSSLSFTGDSSGLSELSARANRPAPQPKATKPVPKVTTKPLDLTPKPTQVQRLAKQATEAKPKKPIILKPNKTSISPQTPGYRAARMGQQALDAVGGAFGKVDEMVSRALLESGVGTEEAIQNYRAAQEADPFRGVADLSGQSFVGNLDPELMRELSGNDAFSGLARFGLNMLAPSNLLPVGGALGTLTKAPKASKALAAGFGVPAVATGAQQVAQGGEGNVVEGLLNMVAGGAGLAHAGRPTPLPAKQIKRGGVAPDAQARVPQALGRPMKPMPQEKAIPAPVDAVQTPKVLLPGTHSSREIATTEINKLLDTIQQSPKMLAIVEEAGIGLNDLYEPVKEGNKWRVAITQKHAEGNAARKSKIAPTETPPVAPTMPAETPKVAEAADNLLQEWSDIKTRIANRTSENLQADFERLAVIEKEQAKGSLRDWVQKFGKPDKKSPFYELAKTYPEIVKEALEQQPSPTPPQSPQTPVEATETGQSGQGGIIPAGETNAPNREIPADDTPILRQGEGVPQSDSLPPVVEKPAATPNQASRTTGAANAVTETERASRNASPIERQAYTLVGDAFEQGKAAVEAGTDARALAASVAQKPRPLTATEVGVLAYDRAQIIKDYDKATAEIASLVDKGKPVPPEMETRREQLLAALDDNDNALVKGGREQSAAFNARKMMVGQDFSFAGVQQRAKAAKGSQLTPQESQQIEALTKRLKDAETALSAAESALKESQAQNLIDSAAQAEGRRTRQAGRARTREALDKEFGELKAQFVKAASKASSGIDPELLPILGQMARNRVAAGINTVAGLVDSLHAELSEVLPDLTKREVQDALSGYGQQPGGRTQSALTKQLNDLKKQARLLSAIEDAEKGQKPAPGQKPGTPSAEVQRLRRQLDAELDKQGIKEKPKWSTDARQAMKERMLRAQIADIERRLKVGDYAPSPKKAGTPDTPQLAKLKTELSALREKWQKAKEPNPLTPEQRREQGRMRAQETRLKKQIEEIEARIKNKDFTPKPTTPIPETPDTAKMKAKLATLREEYNKIKPEPTSAEQQAKAEAAYKTRLEKQITELSEKIAAGDFTLPKRAKVAPTAEVKRLQAHRDLLKAQIQREIDAMKPRTFWEKMAAYQKANLLSSPRGALVDAFSTGVWQAVDNSLMRSLRGSPAEAFHALRGMAASIPHAVEASKQTFREGYSERQARRLDLPTHYEMKSRVGKVISIPARVRAGVNEGQRAIGEGAELYAQAYKTARAEGAADLRARMQELIANPTEKMQAAMEAYGDEATFTQSPDSIARGINQLRYIQVGGARPFEFVVPFFNTVYNLTKTGIQHTPLGFVSLLDKEVRADPVARRQAITRASVGTGAMALLSLKAANGEMTGGVPEDQAERAQFFADGKQPYSIKIGDRWVEYKNFGPFVVPMAVTAAFWNNYAKEGKKNIRDVDMLRAAAAMAYVPLDQTNMFTLEQLLKSDPNKAQQIVGSMASTMVPFSSAARTIGNLTDEWMRDPQVWYEWVQAGLPYVREKLPIKTTGRDSKKRNIPNPQKGANALLPIQTKQWTPPQQKSSSASSDPMAELRRMQREIQRGMSTPNPLK